MVVSETGIIGIVTTKSHNIKRDPFGLVPRSKCCEGKPTIFYVGCNYQTVASGVCKIVQRREGDYKGSKISSIA